VKRNDFAIDDATEFHAGAEYVFPAGKNQVAVRGGVFTNPNHDLKFVGSKNGFGQVVDALFNFVPADKNSETGFTFGGGFVAGGSFQVDGAYLVSDFFNEFSLSAVVRF
jgi:hypothetical protein